MSALQNDSSCRRTLPDNHWPDLLADFIAEKRAAPFVWGKNDCCLFACDWILKARGVDLAEDLRGTYSSALSGWRVVRQLGGVQEIARDRCDKYGFTIVPIGLAGRGSVVTCQTRHGSALGVVIGAHAIFPAPISVAHIRVTECEIAWRIV